jgi:tetratricopeptide (TPR) repeat protein
LNTPAVTAAFQRILGPPVVQDRLAKPVNRTSQLAGDIWFYYGQRYGEFLRDDGQAAAAEDYLYSGVESRPGDPQAYLELARYYSQAKETQRAIAEFRHTLELDGRRADVYSELALLLFDNGRQNEALTEWKAGLEKVEAQPNAATGARIIRDIRSRRQETALRTEIDRALRAAARTLQVWQTPPLLQAAFENSSDDQSFVDVVNASRSPNQLFTALTVLDSATTWLSPRQQKLVFQNAITALSTAPEANRFEYMQMRQRYLLFLLDQKDATEAKRLLDSLNEQERRTPAAQRAEIRLAALQNTVPALLSNYTKNPTEVPQDWLLQETAVDLERQGLADTSRQVLEFLYSRQIERSTNPGAFLGLAEIRVKQGQLTQAVELLRRLNRISAAPFEQLLASSRVLSVNGHPAEAEEFLRLRVQAVPWDSEARLELAKVLIASNRQRDAATQNLQTIVSSAATPYDIRTAAAREQGRARLASSGSTGSRELDVLSNRTPMTPANADALFFFAARTAAAEQATDPGIRVRLLLAAIAERPDDGPARLSLFRAALAARQYRDALAVFRRGDASDVETAAGIAEAHQQLGEFAAAAASFAQAASLEKDPARKDAFLTRQRDAQAANERELENERRRPVIRADVDQPNAVRRRIP